LKETSALQRQIENVLCCKVRNYILLERIWIDIKKKI
jgi:hypothetical protein